MAGTLAALAWGRRGMGQRLREAERRLAALEALEAAALEATAKAAGDRHAVLERHSEALPAALERLFAPPTLK